MDFAEGGRRALRGRQIACLFSGLILVANQQGPPRLPHMPLHVVGQDPGNMLILIGSSGNRAETSGKWSTWDLHAGPHPRGPYPDELDIAPYSDVPLFRSHGDSSSGLAPCRFLVRSCP